MGRIQLLIVGCLLVGWALGASVNECRIKDRMEIYSCTNLLLEYTKKVESVQSWPDMKNETLVKDFQKTCTPLSTCLNSLKPCNLFGDKTEMLSNLVETFCLLVTQVYSNSCYEQLTQETSECVRDWHPILDTDKQSVDEEKKKETCKNYFGTNQCMKKEISEKCGEEEWIKFRDHLIHLNNHVFKQCDFSVVEWN